MHSLAAIKDKREYEKGEIKRYFVFWDRKVEENREPLFGNYFKLLHI